MAAAWSTRALFAIREGDYEEGAEKQKQAIALKPYQMEEYRAYIQMLSQGYTKSAEQGDARNMELCRKAMLEVRDMLKELEDRTTPLAYRIQDKPQFTLPKELEEYLEQLEGRKESSPE